MCKIVDETIRLAKASDLTVDEICEGADIKKRWYYRFVAGDFSDPGINKVLRLHRLVSAGKKCRPKVAA